MVTVSLAAAAICFMGSCYPALIGNNTPSGSFVLSQQGTNEPGYGGDLLAFQEDRKYVWAIHRVYTGSANEHRIERLSSGSIDRRRGITKGCINVMPQVYKKLVDCCSRDMLLIY